VLDALARPGSLREVATVFQITPTDQGPYPRRCTQVGVACSDEAGEKGRALGYSGSLETLADCHRARSSQTTEFQRRTKLQMLANLGLPARCEAADGDAALGPVSEADIIVGDLDMPGDVDGVEFCASLETRRGTAIVTPAGWRRASELGSERTTDSALEVSAPIASSSQRAPARSCRPAPARAAERRSQPAAESRFPHRRGG